MELIGLILGLAVLIFLSFKGWNVIPSTILAVLVLAATNGLNVFDAVLGSYVQGVGNFVVSSFMVFACGSLYGKVMGDSKATVTIAYKLLDLVGKKQVLLVILLSTGLLTYVGINAFVLIFSAYPIVVALCSEANIPKRLPLAAMIVSSSTLVPILPGNASNMHVILANAVGATVTDAPLLGIIGAVIVFVLSYIYLMMEQKKAAKNGEGFVEGTSAFGKMDLSRDNLPGLFVSLLPMIVLLAIIFIGSSFLPAMTAVILGLASAAVLAFALFYKRLPKKTELLNQGIISSIGPLVNVAAIVGFSSVIQSLPIFGKIMDTLMGLPINPVILLVLVMFVLSIITANALGTVAFFVNAVLPRFAGLGIDPGVMLRMGLMGANTTAIMPHCGGMVAIFAVTGSNHKECYRDMFIVGVLIPTISAIFTLPFAFLLG